jgi:hypothetical protein
MPQQIQVVGREVTTLAAALQAGFLGWSPDGGPDAATVPVAGRGGAETKTPVDRVKQYHRG